MNTKIYLFLVLAISVFLFNNLNAQYHFDNTKCEFEAGPIESVSSDPFMGLYKPIRSDLSGINPAPGYAYFPLLIVYVQFKDEYDCPSWPTNQAPIFLDSLISTTKKDITNWWDSYDGDLEMLSDFWLELSRGKLHVVSPAGAVSVVLDYPASNYSEVSMNEEIWQKLQSPSYGIDWREYDRWRKDAIDHRFYYEGDNFVDFIYKIHKSRPEAWEGGNGFNCLSWDPMANFEIDPDNNIWINHGKNNIGSGMTSANLPRKLEIFTAPTHEHGHFLWSYGHITYGKMSYGVGFDLFYSPYEMIYNEYMSPTTITFGQTHNLGDYSSRNSGTGELLKVPIEGEQYFLLANRTKVSKYDRPMMGDTALYDVLNDWDYGKGLYIYHIKNGIQTPSGWMQPQDIECADGFWNWEHGGYYTVYLNCWTGPGFYFFNKTSVRYDNDESPLHTRLLTGDGLSLHYFIGYQNGRPVSSPHHSGIGKIAVDNCHLGTDRIHTNLLERYSSFENKGDRWDAWNVGYNEVFSPYSSPSSDKWNDQESGIFMWYKGDNSNGAIIDIYWSEEFGGNTPLSEILEATPPSRPMGIKIEEDYPPGNPSICHPKIVWEHNQEPDMKNPNNGDEKQYEIYKAKENNMNTVPNNYVWLTTVYSYDDPNNQDDKPYYVDTDERKYDCILLDGPPYGTPIPLRYYVIAVDKYSTPSVHSDFASTIGIDDNGGKEQGGENPIIITNEIPDIFNLHQNFPNPFNPMTNIQFDLPNDIKVSIKVYDITGREVAVLVNEFKKAGSYMVSFNGSKLSSGVYFYKIEAGLFTDIKRMVLVK